MLSCVRSSCFGLWSPPTPVNHAFFFLLLFPFYTFPFLFVTGKHLVSARDPRRVSSPCSLLGSLASIWCYSYTPPTASLTRAHSCKSRRSFTHAKQTRKPLPPHSTDILTGTDSAPALYAGSCVLSLCLSVMDRLSLKPSPHRPPQAYPGDSRVRCAI